MIKTLVILNPISGNGAGARTWPHVESALRSGGLTFDVARTTAPREAIALAERAKRDGYDLLIAIGGDGTVNEVTNGVMRATGGNPGGTVAIIPVGSGNDLAKMFAIPNWRAGVERIIAGRRRTIDIVHVLGDRPAPGYDTPEHYFLNAIDTGFGALVAHHVHDVPFLKGTPLYLVGIFKTLVNYAVPTLRIDMDGRRLEQRSTMTAVANGRCIGGGFWIAPEASVDDGSLDVIIASGLGRAGILSLVPKLMRGTHLGDPRIRFARAACIAVDSPDALTVEADGEILYLGAHHLEIRVLPRHLDVIA